MQGKYFENLYRPVRIRSLKGHESGFKPKWFRWEFWLGIITFACVAIAVIAAMVGGAVLFRLALSGAAISAVGIVVLHLALPTLMFPGCYWPRGGILGARLEVWLEKDLDWRGLK